MPQGPGDKKKKKLTSKQKRAISKTAKAQAGIYGSKGRDLDDKYQKKGSEKVKDQSETGVGRGLRNIKSKITGKRALKLVGRGSKGGPAKINKDRLDKPKTDPVAIGIRKVEGKKTPGGKSTEVAKYDADAKTREGVDKKLSEGMEKTGVSGIRDKKATAVGGDRTLDQNKKKLSAYAIKRAEMVKKRKDLAASRKGGVRTQEQTARDASQDLAKSSYEKEYGTKKGKRKLYNVYKKKLTKEARK